MGLFSSIGKIIGGAGKSSSKTEPWKAAQPYLIDTMEAAGDFFDAGQLGGVRPSLGDTTRAGMSGIAALARGNGVGGMAATSLTDILNAPRFGSEAGYASTLPTQGVQYGNVVGPSATSYGTIAQPAPPQFQGPRGPSPIGIGRTQGPRAIKAGRVSGPSAVNVGNVSGPQSIDVSNVSGPGSFDVGVRLPDGPASYGRVDPNAGIDAVRENIMATALNPIQSMFGVNGFSKSTAAQSAAGRAVANALAPYEYAQIDRVNAENRDQFNREQDRGLNYALASTGLEADQFNVDENRRLGFDVGERNTRLNQSNLNDARRVDFDVNERDTRLNQGNLNDARRVDFGTNERDTRLNQANLNDARRVDFGISERNTALDQANVDMERRLGFDTSQAAARLAQENANADRLNAFNFGLRDRQIEQANLNDERRVAFDTQQHAAKLAQLNQNRDFRIAADDRLRDQYNTEEDRAFGQFFDQNQQQLSALGLAPAISGIEFGNASSLFDLGRFKDQNKANRQEFDLNNVRAAADFFLPFGRLGTNASTKASPLDTIGKIGQGVSSLFGVFS